MHLIHSMRFLPVLLFFLALYSCSKEKFPAEDELQGTWVQETENPEKVRLTFENTTLLERWKTSADTFTYRLDRKQGYIYLQGKTRPQSGESRHKIEISRKGDYLIIWDLFARIPEDPPVAVKFNRE
jgi:hypothetical protein